MLTALLSAIAEPTQKADTLDLKKATTGAFAAFALATNALNIQAAGAAEFQAPLSSSSIIAETVTRQGVYREYDVEITEQAVDDARSTFKDAKETKSKKGKFLWRAVLCALLAIVLTIALLLPFHEGKYTALLAVLVVGSFIIPMAQYFWYVRDDDSSDKFFAEDVPEPPQKKKWF